MEMESAKSLVFIEKVIGRFARTDSLLVDSSKIVLVLIYFEVPTVDNKFDKFINIVMNKWMTDLCFLQNTT